MQQTLAIADYSIERQTTSRSCFYDAFFSASSNAANSRKWLDAKAGRTSTSVWGLMTHSVPIIFSQTSVLSEPEQPSWVSPIQPSGVSPIKDQIVSILHLLEGWDGFQAGPIRHDVLDFALAILRRILRAETPSPHITPMSHEGVQLEWHTDALDLEIEIEEPGSAWVSYKDRSTGLEDEWEVTTDLSSLLTPIARLTNNI